MDLRRRKRQVLLFFFAVLIPASVLIILAVRLAGQERELAERRVSEQRSAAIEQLRRELAARLEAITLQEVNRMTDEADPGNTMKSTDSPVVFVAPLEQGRMVLPWETKQEYPRPAAEFAKHKKDGEAGEYLTLDLQSAAAAYMRALAVARGPVEKCAAQLWAGRVLTKAGRLDEAERIYHTMLGACDSVSDDEGISFALYAAERLISTQARIDEAQDYVLRRARAARWQSPVQAYLIRSLLSRMPTDEAAAARGQLSAEIQEMEEIIALAGDLHRMAVRLDFPFARPLEPVWLAYGHEPWLITLMSPAPNVPPVILAVSSNKVSPPDATLLSKPTPASDPVGDGFLDLHAEWPAGRFAPAAGMPGWLYAAGLALVLSATCFAGYLLLRDVNREVRTAEMRTHFVASVSHELKTPLTAIRMFAETLAMNRTTGELERSEYLETIVNECERLSRLVDNVLDFSRIERGKKIYRMHPACLGAVVRSAARAMQYPLSQQGFTLNISIDEGLPPVAADADALQQAILNLLTNAMKYSGDAREIDVDLKRLGEEAVIGVTDRGVGIAPEDQPRIFDKFYRVRSPDTDLIPGTGLGLTLAAHIAKAHGGRLDVSSAIGRGSTFSLRIPLNTPEFHTRSASAIARSLKTRSASAIARSLKTRSASAIARSLKTRSASAIARSLKTRSASAIARSLKTRSASAIARSLKTRSASAIARSLKTRSASAIARSLKK